MKIAVASSDGVDVADHFGRCGCFVIFEFEDGVVTSREVRANSHTPHARGECAGGGHEEHGMHAHGHGRLLSALGDCRTVLCRGMGWRAAEDLKAHGVQPFVVEGNFTAEEAARAFAAGALTVSGEHCRCH